MKWVDDLKASAAAFKDWGRVLTIIGCVHGRIACCYRP